MQIVPQFPYLVTEGNNNFFLIYCFLNKVTFEATGVNHYYYYYYSH